MSSFKTGSANKKLQPGTVIVGENGLPVDTIATISAAYQIIQDSPTTLSYAAGVVTVNNSVNLAPVRGHKSRYTGRLVLKTKDDAVYFIDKVSVDDTSKTFNIYSNDSQTVIPPSVDTSAGWTIAEAEIVNRLATTSAAKIDSIEFRDMQFQLELDGDPVTVRGQNGNTLEPNADGSINIGNVVAVDTDLTQVENKLDQLIGEAEAANLSLDNIESSADSIDAKLDGVQSELESANLNLDSIEVKLDEVNTNLENIEADTSETVTQLEEANTHLQAIENALTAPLQIGQPVIAAGTVDGEASSAPVIFVNNIKNQILAAHDRQQEIIYADFGTKNQRVVEVIYTSDTFPLFTATKTFTYTLVGNRYRRDTITWSVT